ncbi:MAG: hypothetical protein HYU76_06675 [Betaproteobacteria bacterium]|nr:hypothetical protein [Betaproteobacteria bacterium]
MKRIGLAAALAVLSFLPGLGQAQAEKPGMAKPAAGMKAEQQAAKPAAGTPRRSRANEDARECLQFPTNREIIVCAEKYR